MNTLWRTYRACIASISALIYPSSLSLHEFLFSQSYPFLSSLYSLHIYYTVCSLYSSMFHIISCYITRPQRKQHFFIIAPGGHGACLSSFCFSLSYFHKNFQEKSDVILLSFLRPSHSLSPPFGHSLFPL